jgi:hypothetical protein
MKIRNLLAGTIMAMGATLAAASAQASSVVTFDIAGDLSSIGAYSGKITLDVTGGQATSGSGLINGLGFSNIPMVLITTATPGNETTGGAGAPVGFRANDGTDYFGLDTAFPIDTNGLLFDVDTTTAQFGAFPLLALYSNGNGTDGASFTGNVAGTEFFNESGTLNICDVTTSGVPEPATWAMMLLGVGAIGAGLRTANRRSAMALIPA